MAQMTPWVPPMWVPLVLLPPAPGVLQLRLAVVWVSTGLHPATSQVGG